MRESSTLHLTALFGILNLSLDNPSRGHPYNLRKMAPPSVHSATVDPNLKLLELCTDKSWWRVSHLIKLNMLLFIPFLTSYVGGFDASMLNGIQTVTAWQECQY